MKWHLTIFVVLVSIISAGCIEDGEEDYPIHTEEYRQYMRDLVINISTYSKALDPDLIIIPQNGQELLTTNVNGNMTNSMDYINAIDGIGREDLFYGFDADNKATPGSETEYMMDYLDLAESEGIEVLVTDYCSTSIKMEDSYSRNSEKGYISFSADERDLNDIPPYPEDPFNMNSVNISSLSNAKNFLYVLDPEGFPTRTEYLTALGDTNFDIILMDAFYRDEILTSDEVNKLKTKENGGNRLVISYMSIGEAEDYRYYWNSGWKDEKPSWIEKENPEWKGNFKVRYWDPDWQKIIFGNDDSYLDRIIEAGFDGVYLDIIDAFEYFE